jgi:hypothetical protein
VTEHPGDADLRAFVGHSLAPDRLVALDDHLASCETCRSRALSLGHAASRLETLRTDVLALDEHLSEDEVEHLAAGTLPPHERRRVDRHLAACAVCASDAADLREWVATRSRRRIRPYMVAAAVILLGFVPLAMSRWYAAEQPGGVQRLTGVEALAPEQAASINAALIAGVAEPPAWLAEAGRPETLMGGPATAASFQLTAPVQTVTRSDRPEFRWTALPGAESYVVVVLNAKLSPAAGPATVSGTAWTPPLPLARGASYVWQVTARRGRQSLTVPMPPAPMVRFGVLDQTTAEAIERVLHTAPESHAILGILLAQAGVVAEAEDHLRQVPPTDAHAGVARRTLERLRNIRQAKTQSD